MTGDPGQRQPRVFAPDDPNLVAPEPDERELEASLADPDLAPPPTTTRPTTDHLRRGLSWGGLLVSAMVGLATLAATVSFSRFVAQAVERDDWIGWTATGLAAVAALAATVIILRELVGLMRLARLTRLRRDVERALASRDRSLERSSIRRMRGLYRGRRDLKWGLARLKEHSSDVQDAGDLARLADREVLAPIDRQARRTVLRSAKRVSVVTAISPIIWVAMLFVVVENVRMLKALAGLYGGRPGGVGALRLGRLVLTHILATGGLALTDDLVGQFLGQDLLRRLSRRLGEGAFNGALTARVGTAAIEVTRPLPFLDAPPIRVRDLVSELFKKEIAAAGQPSSRR